MSRAGFFINVADGNDAKHVIQELRTAIVTNARQLYLSGSIPDIQRLVFLEKINFAGSGVLVTRDAIADETSAVPIQSLDGQSGTVQNPRGGIFWRDRKQAIRVPCSAGDGELCLPWKEYVGTHEGLLSLVEGEAAWMQAANGSRFPKVSYFPEVMLDSRELPFEDATTFQAHSTLTCSMWRKDTSWDTVGPAKGPYLLGRVSLVYRRSRSAGEGAEKLVLEIWRPK
jgi:hypothetical protein